MNAGGDLNSGCKKLIEELTHGVDTAEETKDVCQNVKRVLESQFRDGATLIPPQYLRTSEGSYARRCLYREPNGKFTIVVMVWDVGQGTPLHDHAGHWCVECVYQGSIEVTSYDLEEENSDGLVRFRKDRSVIAGIGAAGALIPPFEYHTIQNVEQSRAVTVHVYGGEITWCHTFEPTERPGHYQRHRRELAYVAV